MENLSSVQNVNKMLGLVLAQLAGSAQVTMIRSSAKVHRTTAAR